MSLIAVDPIQPLADRAKTGEREANETCASGLYRSFLVLPNRWTVRSSTETAADREAPTTYLMAQS